MTDKQNPERKARDYKATPITHNTGEFSRAAGLRMEDREVA